MPVTSITIGNFIYEKQYDEDISFLKKKVEKFIENKRNGRTYSVHLNNNYFGEQYDWAMVQFEPDAGDNGFQVDGDRGYYDKTLYLGKILCFLKA